MRWAQRWDAERKLAIPVREFDYLRDLVRSHSAIAIESGNEYIAESRLAHLAIKEGQSSVSALLLQLRERPFGPLHRKVLDAMTNNETWFFRDLHPFETIRRFLLPELIAKRSSQRAAEHLERSFIERPGGLQPRDVVGGAISRAANLDGEHSGNRLFVGDPEPGARGTLFADGSEPRPSSAAADTLFSARRHGVGDQGKPAPAGELRTHEPGQAVAFHAPWTSSCCATC